MRDELPSGLVLPAGVRPENVEFVGHDPACPFGEPVRLTPRVAALRHWVRSIGPALARYYRAQKAWR